MLLVKAKFWFCSLKSDSLAQSPSSRSRDILRSWAWQEDGFHLPKQKERTIQNHSDLWFRLWEILAKQEDDAVSGEI